VEGQTSFDRQAFAATVDSLVADYLVDGPVAGVAMAVEKDGEVILARGYGLAEVELNVPVTVETVFRIGSISKQFAAVAILQLVEQGLVNLDDPITKFIPDYPTQGHEVTVHHLLTHTSGIVSYTGMGEIFWSKSRLDLSHEEMIDVFGDEPFEFAPGEKWNYNNSGFYLLGVIVEKVQPKIVASRGPLRSSDVGTAALGPAGVESMYGAPSTFPRTAAARRAAEESFAEYLQTHIFKPIGMTASSYCDQTAIVPHRAEGYERENGQLVNDAPLSMNIPGAAGALCSTVLDMLRWQRALDNNTLINAESRAMMLKEATLNDGSATGYSYGLFVGDFEGHRKVSHGGGINGFNTQHATYPDDNLVVTIFANTNGAAPGQLEEQLTRLVFGLPLNVTLDLSTDGVDLGSYTGTYFFEQPQIRATVEVRDGQLWLVGEGIGEARLKYQGGNEFEMAPGQRIQFSPDANPPTATLSAGGSSFTGVREGG